MATPVLYQNVDTVNAYFPVNSNWYNFHSGEEVKLDKDRRFLVNNKVEDLVPLFQLEGTIV